MLNMIYVYCDESCHLPNDDSDVMVLGGISYDGNELTLVKTSIRLIKKNKS